MWTLLLEAAWPVNMWSGRLLLWISCFLGFINRDILVSTISRNISSWETDNGIHCVGTQICNSVVMNTPNTLSEITTRALTITSITMPPQLCREHVEPSENASPMIMLFPSEILVVILDVKFIKRRWLTPSKRVSVSALTGWQCLKSGSPNTVTAETFEH